MNKPKLSLSKIWSLSFGFLGVQVCASLQYSNSSTIFESYGADLSHLSYFWLAAPLVGLLVQPLVGFGSDRTWCRFGRRMPYIICGAIVTALAMLLLPNVNILFAAAPLILAAIMLFFEDLALNATMQPFRSLVGDMLNDEQKTRGFAVQTIIINIGAVVGSFLPLLLTKLGVSDHAESGALADHIKYSYYIGIVILLATVAITVLKIKEYSPTQMVGYGAEKSESKIKIGEVIRTLPPIFYKLAVVQFFSWAALVLMWTYLKPAITGVVTNHQTGELLSLGQTQSWVGVLNGTYPVPACIAAFFVSGLAAKYGHKIVYSISLLCGAIGFSSLVLVSDQYAMMCSMIGVGIAWAGMLSMPFSMLARSVEASRMGVYMGLFTLSIIIPQIVVSIFGGVIVKYIFDSQPMMMMLAAGVSMLIASISVVFIGKD